MRVGKRSFGPAENYLYESFQNCLLWGYIRCRHAEMDFWRTQSIRI